jgi:hypothetical protein
MKVPRALAFLLAAAPLFGQVFLPQPSSGDIWLDENGNVVSAKLGKFHVHFQFSYPSGVKTLTLTEEDCNGPYLRYKLIPPLFLPVFSDCKPADDELEDFSAVAEKVSVLFNWAHGAPWNIVYKAAPGAVRPLLTTMQPNAPPAPSMALVDGLGGNILQLDLKTGKALSNVTPPQGAIGPLAIRPALFPPFTEVWVANGSSQVSVLNMSAQTVVTNIRTPSVPAGALPSGIVFSNGGDQAFEAFQLRSPDASGNTGLLVVFDAVNRVVTSTFPLKYGPTAFLMSPDGLTAYLLGSGGQLTYYDVLSGTADLSFSTYAPGSNAGYNGVSNVFIHPDGTRLFWAVGPYLESFNLTTRKVTGQFNSGLPTTSAITLEVSQDGSTATMGNGQGAVAIFDTQYGLVEYTMQYDSPTLTFPGF